MCNLLPVTPCKIGKFLQFSDLRSCNLLNNRSDIRETGEPLSKIAAHVTLWILHAITGWLQSPTVVRLSPLPVEKADLASFLFLQIQFQLH